MIKPNKKQPFDVGSLSNEIQDVLKTNRLGSISRDIKKHPIGNILFKKDIIMTVIIIVIMLSVIGSSIYVISLMFGSSGFVFSAGIVLLILLVLLCFYIVYRNCKKIIDRVFYTMSVNSSAKMQDCVVGIIVSKTEDAYIVSSKGSKTTMVDYYCIYVFYDGNNLRQGVFRSCSSKDISDKYDIGNNLLVCFNAKSSVAIEDCSVSEYRGIKYNRIRGQATRFLQDLKTASAPKRAKQIESKGRFFARIVGLLVFGTGLIVLGGYMWAELELSPNMIVTVRTLATIFCVLGGGMAILGFVSIFKTIYLYINYINLIKNCNFAYGLMIDDGKSNKKRGYTFLYYDLNGNLCEHISSVDVSKRVTVFDENDSKPIIILVAYNTTNIDIIDKIKPNDVNYPI